jgi:hypothetical protein
VANYEPEPFVQNLHPNAIQPSPELVSAHNGHAAWVLFTPEFLGSPATESVVVHDGAGTRSVAGYRVTGPPYHESVEITALRIGGGDVVWEHLGEPRSAPLD